MGEPATPTAQDRADIRTEARSIIEAVRSDRSIAESIGFSRHITSYDKGQIEPLLAAMAQEIAALKDERDDARSIARVIAHSYQRDSRPPATAIRDAMLFPVIREEP
jgi:hypothetical protein